jgi:hypothetical protein
MPCLHLTAQLIEPTYCANEPLQLYTLLELSTVLRQIYRLAMPLVIYLISIAVLIWIKELGIWRLQQYIKEA